MVKISILICILVISKISSFEENKMPFHHYVEKHGKEYHNVHEFEFRRHLFNHRVASFKKFNSENHGWKKKVNMFTDMTKAERAKYLGGINKKSDADNNEIEDDSDEETPVSEEDEEPERMLSTMNTEFHYHYHFDSGLMTL